MLSLGWFRQVIGLIWENSSGICDLMHRKLITYIDGQNLLAGMLEADLGFHRWLDVCALAERLAPPDHELVQTRYYTARRKGGDELERDASNDYLDALEQWRKNEVSLVYGFMRPGAVQCDHCGRHSDRYQEKRTDVNIAVDMVGDALSERFDTAMLISGDADLVGAVEAVARHGKQVVLATPPKRDSAHLREVATHVLGPISKSKIRKSKLPDAIDLDNGYRIRRPQIWTRPPGPQG